MRGNVKRLSRDGIAGAPRQKRRRERGCGKAEEKGGKNGAAHEFPPERNIDRPDPKPVRAEVRSIRTDLARPLHRNLVAQDSNRGAIRPHIGQRYALLFDHHARMGIAFGHRTIERFPVAQA